jgi:CheY-like chemotaxis protein
MGEKTKKHNLVVVIDDDDINNFLCEKVIKSSNVSEKMRSYLNGRVAMDDIKEAIAGNRPEDIPSVVFLDINMPVMNGWEFLNELEPLVKKHGLHTRVAILSSSVFQKDKERADKYQVVVDYISKPLSIATVKDFFKRLSQ